ncbi:MAG TPA: response regulator [Labilithrix sp.]|nr:response regulator [Labilithrix sp.]
MTTLRALVVDDSLTVRMDLAEGLRAGGFDVVASSSLTEARAALEHARFDVAILDMRLGDGTGVDLLCEIRAKEAVLGHMPVMMLSSEAEVGDRVRGLSKGADEYAGKPYVLSYVVARARELAGEHRSTPPPAQPTILVIDDSLSFREAIREELESAGYRAITAETGEDGLQKAAALRPALLLVDGQLPGIDGATVIRRLRLDAALRHTPCIMITGSDVPGGEIGAFEAGVDAYLSKRTSPAEVVARVASMLASTTAPFASVRTALGANKLLLIGRGLSSLSAALRSESFDVAIAASPEEAVPLLKVETPSCVILDVTTAVASCKTVRAALSSPCAVMALTGDGDSALVIDCLVAGVDEVVSRETPAPLLVARIRAQLRRKQIEAEAARERDARLARELWIAEARAAQQLADVRAEHLAVLEQKNVELAVANAELEAFSYSVSHDLRAPLRAIEGFTRALVEDQGHLLEDIGRKHLDRVHGATDRMSQLIDDLLQLSRVTRSELRRQPVDLTALARTVLSEMTSRNLARPVDLDVQEGLQVSADPGLLRAVLENLLGNAWKFSSKRERTMIRVGRIDVDGVATYFVRDNGVGFDMAMADKLFRPFQRLHSSRDFEGTGIGLATVRRIVSRHGGRAWAEASPDEGTTIYFTLG